MQGQLARYVEQQSPGRRVPPCAASGGILRRSGLIIGRRPSRNDVPRGAAQARPGGKILLTLSGRLYGYAGVLLTVAEDGTSKWQLLPGTVSFRSLEEIRPKGAPAGAPFGRISSKDQEPVVGTHPSASEYAE
ncbi:hypothetical protein GCM10027072_76720 [Streptomyces bullii]